MNMFVLHSVFIYIIGMTSFCFGINELS